MLSSIFLRNVVRAKRCESLFLALRKMTNNENVFSQPSPKKAKPTNAGDAGDATALKFKKISEHAQPPRYGSAGAAGADLCSAEECVVPAKGKYLVSTGLQLAVPVGFYGRVAPRSGLAVKHFIDVGAGVVDADYRGEVKVLLFNFGDEDFTVKVGDRIAQFICEKCSRFPLLEVDSLEETARGDGGFGSTGVSTPIPVSENTA